jgi:hypothetical protein
MEEVWDTNSFYPYPEATILIVITAIRLQFKMSEMHCREVFNLKHSA